MKSLAKPRIAYLTGEFPKVSHTFILREIEALRLQGLEVQTCSIRRTGTEHHRGASERAAADTTFYVLQTARNPLRLLGAVLAGLARPGRFLEGIGLAWRTRPPGLRAAFYQLVYLIEALVLSRHLRDQNVTHLHNHFANSSCSVAMLTSVVSGIPFSFTMHGPSIFFEPRVWRIDEKIARARFVSCISHFCRSQGMLFSDPSHWHKLRIVHCGVTTANYGNALETEYGKHAIFVGRLDPIKGVPLLLEAFAAARSRHSDARLTVVGDGIARSSLEAQARELGIASKVTFTGYRSQEEVSELLEEADMLILPSFAEGVPVVLMEAMATRIPVIASQVGGVAELVEEGKSGFLIPAGDVDTLTARMVSLFDDPELCRAFGETGRAKVLEDFDIDKEATWLAALLKGEGEGLRPNKPSSQPQAQLATGDAL